MRVSVIMPVERLGGDAEKAIDSILAQDAPFPFELIVVSAQPLNLPGDIRVRNVVEADRNPARRRNRAAAQAQGDILAFLDDDARADPGWLRTAVQYLDENFAVLAVGGPDPAPPDSSPAELISETLLRTRFIGSGVAAHEDRPGIFPIEAASDIALVNLFVRRNAFAGFDESIGYIGEDTRLIEELMRKGMVMYHHGVRVFHRRRPFPAAYLKQRWRYRVKTGMMLARRERQPSNQIWAFLFFGTIGIILSPMIILPYALFTFLLGVLHTRLPFYLWPVIPAAFALHHLTYYFGLLWGMLRGTLTRR